MVVKCVLFVRQTELYYVKLLIVGTKHKVVADT